MEVSVGPAGGRGRLRRGPPVAERSQQVEPLGQPLLGQRVEGAVGVVLTGPQAQAGGQPGAVARVGGAVAGGLRDGGADLVQCAVQPPEQRAQRVALREVELGAVPVAALDPGEEREEPPAEGGDRPAVGGRQRRRDGQPPGVQPGGGPVLGGDGRPVRGGGVDVALEEVRPGLGGDPVAPVEQALGDRGGGQQPAHPVALEHGGQCGVRDGRAQCPYRRRLEVGPGGRPGERAPGGGRDHGRDHGQGRPEREGRGATGEQRRGEACRGEG